VVRCQHPARLPWGPFLGLALCIYACGGPGGSADGGDGAPDAGTPTAPFPPWLAEGAPPIAPPSFDGCPAGWQPVEAGGATVCEPWPGDVGACPSGEGRFPGQEACGPIGPPCPAGGFPGDLPADASIVYVLGGSASGDGTQARPWGALSEFSVSGLPRGTVVALGRGTYDAARLPRAIVLWGACTAETVITASAPDMLTGSLHVVGAGASARNLTIRSGGRPGVSALGDGDSIHLTDLVVVGATATGLLAVYGGEITGERVVVRDTMPNPDGSRGRAISVETGGRAELHQGLFEGSRNVAAFVSRSGALLVLEDSALRETDSTASDLGAGRAVSAEEGGQLELRRAVLERQRDVGLFVGDPGSSAVLEDVLVRDTDSIRASGQDGMGLAVTGGAVASGSRLWVHASRHAGLYGREDSSMTLSDVVVTDTRGLASDETSGAGLDAHGGPSVDLRRAVLSGSRLVGILAGAGGSSLHLEDLVVRDTVGQEADGAFGRGLSIQPGAVVSGSRILVERSREIGLFVAGPDATVSLDDLAVRDTGGDIFGLLGRGLSVQVGATVEVTGALFDRNREVSVLAGGDMARVSLRETVVRSTLPRECVLDRCAGAGIGNGFGAYLTGRIEAVDFVLEGSALCGVHVAMDGEMDLADGEVWGSPIGACVQVDGYDVDRLRAGVRYRDNDSNLMATSLPVPDALAPGFGGG